MSYIKKAVKGSAIIFAFTIISVILGYLTRIVLARGLSVEEYGLFYAVFGLVSFFLFFRQLGLDSAMVKYVAEYTAKKAHNKKRVNLSAYSFCILYFNC